MALQSCPQVRFGGQITGVEGYVESAASGLWVGLRLAADLRGLALPLPPQTTSLGAMLHHVIDASVPDFQPSNVHFGLFEPLPPMAMPAQGRAPKMGKADRKAAHTERARQALGDWMARCNAAIDGGGTLLPAA